MKPLQALLTWVTYELSCGLVVRDLEPLAMAPLDEKLASIGLKPSGAFAAIRHAIRNSMRVLRVAYHGMEGLPNADPPDIAQFESDWAAISMPGDRKQASEDCQTILKNIDSVFALEELNEDLLYQTIAYSDAILAPRAMKMQEKFAGHFLLEGLKSQVHESSPLIQGIEHRDLLREGILYFFIEQIRIVPQIDQIITQIASLDKDGVENDVKARVEDYEAKIAVADDEKKERIQDQIYALGNVRITIGTQLEIAQTLAQLRIGYQALMDPVILELDELYRGIEDGTDIVKEAAAAVIEMPTEDVPVVERYAMPIEKSQEPGLDESGERPLPNDSQAVFEMANDLFGKDRYKKAIKLYNRAIDLDPNLAAAHFNLSQAYLRLGKWSNALASYQQGVFIDPKLRMVPQEFEIEEILGAGGMGILFRVRDKKKNRLCTLRVIRPSLTTKGTRMKEFVDQLKALRNVESKSVAKVFDLRKFKNHHLLACEYVKATSLRQMIKSGPLAPERVMRIFRRLCDCINVAHNEGVVHNNLKPSCIFVDGHDNVKISEFALMALIEQTEGALQASGLPLEYLAPEQHERHAEDERSDVYALAMILYEMLTGTRWEPGSVLPESIDPGLAQLITQGLAEAPHERCFVEDILDVVGETTMASGPQMITLELSEELSLEERAPVLGDAPVGDAPSGMILVGEGEFTMGHDDDAAASPAHQVHVASYYIDKYPVTNRQYRDFIGKTGYKSPFVNAPWAAPYNWKKGTYPAGTDDHPVVLVSWHDAAAYAKFMNKRLPTEAEWEKAARGADERLYPWGNDITPSHANYMQTKIVAVNAQSKNVSPYGCVAMSGNVWEWVADWFEKGFYGRSPKADPKGPGMGKVKVIRGGAFDSVEEAIRTYFRFRHKPHLQSFFIGFRLAKDV